MSTSRVRVLLAVLAVVVIAAVAAFWWAGRTPPTTSPQTPPSTSAPVSVASTNAPFAVLSCQARLFDDSPALAVTFSQPLDTAQQLNTVLRASDIGDAGENDKPTGEIREGSGAGGTLRNVNWVIGDNPRVAYMPFVTPQKKYRVDIDAGVRQRDGGGTLGAGSHCEVATEAMPPSFYFASRGVVLPAAQNGGLPVVTVNVPEVDVQFLRIGPDQMPAFFERVLGVRPAPAASAQEEESEDDYGYYGGTNSMRGRTGTWELDRLKDMATSVHLGRYATDEAKNRRHTSFLPVEGIKELQQPGIYVAVMSQPGRFRDDYQVTYFYVTDIGMHVRRFPGRIDAFASSLKTGQAVTDAELRLLDEQGKELARTKLDAKGHVSFEGDFARARLMLAQRGNEMSVIALHEPALDLSEFDIGGLPARTNRLFAYSGRDLYRPGERFEVSVLDRGADGQAVAAVPLTATLKRPDGRVVNRSVWPVAATTPGYRQQAVALPVDAQTGTWMLELRVDPGSPAADSVLSFQVEEFLPERMKLTLDAGDAVIGPDEPVDIDVQGDYLYGAPAAGNRVLSVVSISRLRNPLPQQLPGFIFGDVADDDRKLRQELPEIELDEQGKAPLRVPVEIGDVRSVMRARVAVSLLETAGRPVVRTVDAMRWPTEQLIGVRPAFGNDVTSSDGLAQFEVVRANAKGEVLPVNGVAVRLYREQRRYYWRYDDQQGWHSGFTEEEELVDARNIDLAPRAQLSLQVGWGRYRLEMTDPDSGVLMRYRFYAGWDAQDAEEIGNRPDRVQLRVEGTPLRDGAPIKLTVTPPHDGEAIISVEGQQLLWTSRHAVKATGTQIEIPMDAAWQRHDLYVSAVVMRPGNQGQGVTPARAVGLAHLPLSREDRVLKVALDAPAKVRPERTSTVGVKVEGAAGKQAHVTLSAVDVGILQITRYASPDPAGFFFGKQRYAADMLDMYGKLIEKMDGTPAKQRWGGDANMRESRNMPSKVKLVDLFSGVVTLDAEGRAQIPLNIPDFNGTLRLMAVAFTEDRFGHAEAEMTVAAPIVAELSTPRFITTGDEATVALDLTNLSGAAQNVSVTLEAGSPLQVVEASHSVRLADKQRTSVRFRVGADAPVGAGVLRLRVTGRGGPEPVDIVRESRLDVQPLWAATRNAYRARIEPGQAWTPAPNWLDGMFGSGATVSVTASSQPPFNVPQLVRGLLEYPYACTEQTLSAAYPVLLIDEAAAKKFGLNALTGEQRARRIDQAIARLASMQQSSGGLTLWGSGAPDAWLSAYVLGFLQDARSAGFTVPEEAATRTRNWLLAQLQSAPNYFPSLPTMTRGTNGQYASRDAELLRNSHRRFADLSHAAFVLARDNQAPLSTLRVLADRYADRALSPLPLVHLSLALRAMGDAPRADKVLDLAMSKPYGLNGGGMDWLGDYGSALRDNAMSYALLADAKVAHPRRELLLQNIANSMGNRRYFSTQEQFALVRAALAAGGGDQWQAHWEEGGQQIAWEGGPALTREIDPSVLADTRLVNDGQEPLFVEAQVQAYPISPDTRSTDGVSIERTWFRPDGSRYTGGPLRSGDTLVAHVRLNSRLRIDDALVVDRVPAGLEVENANLVAGSGSDTWSIDGVDVQRAMQDADIRHTEFRDDRFVAAVRLQGRKSLFYTLRVVTPGTYKVPVPLVEDMYRPEIRATGSRGPDLVVTDPRAARP